MKKLLIILGVISISAQAATQDQIDTCRRIDNIYDSIMVMASRNLIGVENVPIDKRGKIINKVMDDATAIVTKQASAYYKLPYPKKPLKWADIRDAEAYCINVFN